MSNYCERHSGRTDDNFLLDDENSFVKPCTCRKNSCKTSQKNVINNTSNIAVVTVHTEETPRMDENLNTLEDSPLLINDCYIETSDEFHCHDNLFHYEDNKAWKKLMITSILCLIFMITEIVGGLLASSLAVMTDAAHLFSDLIGFLISLLSIWISKKSATKTMTFGYYRAEVLGAFLSVLTIWLLAGIFVVLAINRLLKKDYEINADTMILIASLGLFINILMGAVLHGYCHSHSHNHNQNQTNSNINVRAAAAHVLGDLLQSIGVLISAIVIKIFPNAKIADPICTILFAIIVIFTTIRVARDSIWFLLEGGPNNTNDLLYELKKLTNIKHIHNLHVWTLSPGRNAVSVHLCVDRYCDRDVILKDATNLIKNHINIISCTIQIEGYNPDLVNSCKQCQPFYC